jgi:hypothetical protein
MASRGFSIKGKDFREHLKIMIGLNIKISQFCSYITAALMLLFLHMGSNISYHTISNHLHQKINGTIEDL